MRNTPDRMDIANALSKVRNDDNHAEWTTACIAMADLLTHDDATRTAFLAICGLDTPLR